MSLERPLPTSRWQPWASSKPYQQRLCRLEYRPGRGDPTATVSLLRDNGYDLVVSGAINGMGEAFYPTQFYPPVSYMDPEYVPRLIDLCHASDIMILSWVPKTCFGWTTMRWWSSTWQEQHSGKCGPAPTP